MLVWLVALGVASILGQVVLLRELLVAFFGSELIYLLAFGFLLCATAVGVLAGPRLAPPSGGHVRLLLLAFAVLLPLLLALVRGLRILFGGTPGAYLPFPHQLLGMALVLLPFGALLGLLFHRVATIYTRRPGTLASAYAIESAGGLVGGVLATVFLKWGLQNLAAALICGLIAVAGACVPRRGDRLGRFLPGAAVLGAVLFAGLLWSGAVDKRLTALNHPNLVETRDTPYGRVSIEESLGQLSVFENDGLVFESQGTEAEEFVHLAALQVAEPRSVLILGGGLEGLASQALAHRPEKVDAVVIDPIFLDLIGGRLSEETLRRLQAGGVRFAVGDPRRFLTESARYDLILTAMGEPESGQTNRFYTREFFAACREHLAPGGVLAFRLRAAENLWSPALVRRTASIHHALAAVFADVLVLPGSTNILLASDVRLERDPEVVAARWRARRIAARLVSPAYIRYLLTNDRLAEVAGLLDGARVPANTDARPICYQYTLILWLSRFFPILGLLELPESWSAGSGPLRGLWLAAPLLVWTTVLLACRRFASCRRVLLVAGAGFIGMVLEAVLILGYQVQYGVLYQDLGILLTMFMGGLSLGALGMDRAARRRGPAGRRALGMGLAGATGGLCGLVAWLLHAGIPMGLAPTSLLLVAVGLLVGALFAYASFWRVPSQSEVISPLYAADLLGGCIGSLVGSLFLVPVLGLHGSAVLVGVLALVSFLLV